MFHFPLFVPHNIYFQSEARCSEHKEKHAAEKCNCLGSNNSGSEELYKV